ncbi:homeobox protein BEL1 homolog isoform X2 [Macadamia integrifolia]|uniref:homeobox protein BEL1 homolog isoform X2 n=1 Tax=Macadamia integrifolia TaxID=60698 RepID=UPI001C4F647E|nr:homeobox protein BEL1 homolog isoform X2 [Macadamia integrifolia]
MRIRRNPLTYWGTSSDNPTINIANQMQSYESDSELFNLTTGMEMLGIPYHQPEFKKPNISTGFSEESLMVDDSSLRCVFPCEGNERPSQGLSLSLSSNKPSSIGLQSFELRETTSHHHHHQQFIPSNSRDGFFGKSAILQEQDFELKSSKYFVSAQELLNEFCSLEINKTDPPKQEPPKTNQWEDGSSSCKQSLSLSTSELLELQKRKAKLISMLEEVDRRYRQYCDQMKAVAASFEAVAGAGAAKVYSASASKAMSRHFRCLRDGIVGQIKVTKKAIGEEDHPGTSGTTRGDTPRLKLLDQTLRQQKAFQQMGMMESHPWRPQRGLPERSVSVLRAWLFEHFLHPYPSDVDKHILARQTGLSRSQVSNWFINARVRLWKPMVEEMYFEETKEKQQDNVGSSSLDGVTGPSHNDNLQSRSGEDMKPRIEKLVRGNSDSQSFIISNPDKEEENRKHFGVGDLDFSYNNHMAMANTVSYPGTGVSLTLGLQHQEGNLSLFFPRDQLEDCQSVNYSILDGEGQNLPCRNLMGAQLLHDLAG